MKSIIYVIIVSIGFWIFAAIITSIGPIRNAFLYIDKMIGMPISMIFLILMYSFFVIPSLRKKLINIIKSLKK